MTLQWKYRVGFVTGERFTDSQFLVFVNRILAFLVAFIYMQLRPQPPHRAPLFKYSYSSFSNIMSSWFQYESLKFVSFPTQVSAAFRTVRMFYISVVSFPRSCQTLAYSCS